MTRSTAKDDWRRLQVAKMIDKMAWEDFDDLTPTERSIWNDASKNHQRDALAKADLIIAFLTHGQGEKVR